jgi:hypothetical protein
MHLLPEPLFVLPTDSLQTRTLAGTDNGRSVLILAGLRIRMDPHYFELLDPDPHSNCGSGSRRAKMTHINRKSTEISCFEVLDVLFCGLL